MMPERRRSVNSLRYIKQRIIERNERERDYAPGIWNGAESPEGAGGMYINRRSERLKHTQGTKKFLVSITC